MSDSSGSGVSLAATAPPAGARVGLPAAPVIAATPLPTPPPAPAPKPAPPAPPAPAPAAPPPPSTPDGMGAAALARIHYPFQRLGYSIAFHGTLQGYLGLTDCTNHHIDVYVRPSESLDQVTFVTAFEMAHAVDCSFTSDSGRAAWASIRGFPAGWMWYPPCVCSEDNYGSGDFSDVFATWLAGPGGWPWRSRLAPAPDAAELARLMPYLLPASVQG
ncbi:MAG TPA: hypothetical protein VFA11_05845 [Acidimicrobiales bacterium]|nr:hypothetical protein [Acidimicrobiales bacterium]